jgi:hypothetical protein
VRQSLSEHQWRSLQTDQAVFESGVSGIVSDLQDPETWDPAPVEFCALGFQSSASGIPHLPGCAEGADLFLQDSRGIVLQEGTSAATRAYKGGSDAEDDLQGDVGNHSPDENALANV